MLSSWCLGPSRGRGAGGRSSEHLPPSESEGGLLTSIWKDRPHVLSSGTSPPAPPRFRAEPRGQSGCRQLSGRQDGGCVWAGWGRRGWGFLWVAVVLCSCQRHGQDPPSSANLPSGSPDLPPAISLLGQNPAIWALGAPPIPIGAETPEGPHRDARGSPRAQPARLGAPGLTRVRRGELILLFINLGEPNSPSRSQAGFAAIWKLLVSLLPSLRRCPWRWERCPRDAEVGPRRGRPCRRGDRAQSTVGTSRLVARGSAEEADLAWVLSDVQTWRGWAAVPEPSMWCTRSHLRPSPQTPGFISSYTPSLPH